MALQDIFAELEAALADGIVERYAIGGAVGATFSMDEVLRAKAAARAIEARTPIAEKLRILERLRERDRAIKRAVILTAPRQPRDDSA
jgi:hypothetical protein